MLFTSAIFLLCFLPCTLLGYQLLGKFGRRATISWLAVASLIFYSYWNPKYVALLLASVGMNFAISKAIAAAEGDEERRHWKIAGVVANLLILGYFKYLFPTLSFLNVIGLGHRTWTAIVLPLGISFFTFTQIAYLIDLSEGEAPSQGFGEYLLFVTIFPHLIAGPILHHSEIMPQLSRPGPYKLNHDDIFVGLSWFVIGLAKKTMFADQLSPVADATFRNVSMQSTSGAWLGVLCYSMQLYFDFSGYSDMAVGLARMVSLQFPLNFNSPYKAASIIDFWARWHMTLTRYLTLYLYNPLSLSIRRRRLSSGLKISQNVQKTVPGFLEIVATPTLVTMGIAGVWHGAGSQFFVFGALHGFYLTVNHWWRLWHPKLLVSQAPRIVTQVASVLLTYGCVLIGQIFFRASSTGSALQLLGRLSGLIHQPSFTPLQPLALPSVFLLVALFPIVWFLPNTQEILGQVPSGQRYKKMLGNMAFTNNWAWTVTMGVLFVFALLFTSSSATFLYFQF